MNPELIKKLEKIEQERQKGTTFQKRLTMNDLTKVASELDPSYPETEDVADNATAAMQELNYSESMRKKLVSQLTSMFKLDLNAETYYLRGQLRDEIACLCDNIKRDQEYLAFYYFCLMMLSYKNFAELVAALAPFKRSKTLFTLKIFVQSLPEAAKAKSPATTYEICDQFLMQMQEFGFLTKVDQVYRVKDVKLGDYREDFGREVLFRLPVELEEDLYEVLGIEILPKPAPEAVQD